MSPEALKYIDHESNARLNDGPCSIFSLTTQFLGFADLDVVTGNGKIDQVQSPETTELYLLPLPNKETLIEQTYHLKRKQARK
jgi:hypothetical protein